MLTTRDLLQTTTILALAFGPACAVDETDEFGAPLLGEDEDDGVLPSGADSLTTQQAVGAVPGFEVSASVIGDDVVLDWTASGITPNPGDDMVILRSEDPDLLISLNEQGAIDAIDAGLMQDFVADGPTGHVDPGAASRTSPTPTYFYRIIRVTSANNALGFVFANESTMLAKVTTEVSPGYNKIAMCLQGGDASASDLLATMGEGATGVWGWNAQTQSYLNWLPADGAGSDFALPYGSVASVHIGDGADPYRSIAGVVPTHESFDAASLPGLNWATLPLLYDGPVEASHWVEEVGYWGVGLWDAVSQQASWYWGAGDSDFDMEPCRPYYMQISTDACNADADCNEGQFCEFEEATSCGSFGAGQCKHLPLGCAEQAVEPVCGCDDVTYDNACEAGLAGVSVSSEGECPPPPISCPCVEASFIWDLFVSDPSLPQACYYESTPDSEVLWVSFDPAGDPILVTVDGVGGGFCAAIDIGLPLTEEEATACYDLTVQVLTDVGLECTPF